MQPSYKTVFYKSLSERLSRYNIEEWRRLQHLTPVIRVVGDVYSALAPVYLAQTDLSNRLSKKLLEALPVEKNQVYL